MIGRWLKVGELASRTGLTVRTLHHWDTIGLLPPDGRTDTGHRLYGEAALARLQRIVALRAMGLSLDEISGLLDDPDWDLLAVLDRQIVWLDAEIERQAALRARVQRVRELVARERDLEVDVVLDVIKETIDMEKYYAKDQLDELAARAEALGPEGMQRAQDEWAELFAELRRHMESGVEPDDPVLDASLTRYRTLIEAFTGGNPGIRKNLQRAYDEESPERASHGMVDRELFAWVGRAMAVREESSQE